MRGSRSGEHGDWLELGGSLSTQVGFAGALRFRPLSEVCVCPDKKELHKNRCKSSNMSGTLYTCGRVHKPHKLKLKPHSANANAVIDAVHKIMQEELSQAARERWCSRLDAELGKGTFGPTPTLDATPIAVPRVWTPAKPKLALALLDEFLQDHDDPQASPPKKSIGAGGPISKLLTRRAIERLVRNKGNDWMEASGELTADQLGNATRLNQTLSRAAFDLLVYVHARATEIQREDGADVVLTLHSSDETVVGRAMRGCGVVYCEAGRAVFARAVALVRNALIGNE